MGLTDEEAALRAIESFASADRLSQVQSEAHAQIHKILGSDDPFIDIHTLFGHFNTLYFRGLLVPRVEVSWRPKMTVCAGLCELVRDPENNNKYTKIRLKLSEALLKYRARSDVIDTLLHEAIHAYFFITTSWKHSRGEDGTGHGDGFLLLADAINSHGGYGVTVYHNFHDEVDSYRTHIWQCDGICKDRAPHFGLVKRSMNRPPSKNDLWWPEHEKNCGGTFSKIAEPEVTKDQLRRMTPMQRAGRQSNKIDSWIAKPKKNNTKSATNDTSSMIETGTGIDTAAPEADGGVSGLNSAIETAACPICNQYIALKDMNDHLDTEH